jgi:FkbM family methyltransferase
MAMQNITTQTRYGLMIHGVGDTVVGRSLMAYGEWAQSEMDLLATWVRPGDWVVDAGAYIGTHTLFFGKTVGAHGRVFAFEPQRLSFQTLCGNVALNSLTCVHTYQAALGEAPGLIKGHITDYERHDNQGSYSFLYDGEVEDTGLSESIPRMTIDSLGLERCELIKCDVEAMEKQVLVGAEATIESHRPILFVENNFPAESHALVRQVDAYGYDIWLQESHDFNPDNFRGETRDVLWGFFDINMLCIPKERAACVDGLVRFEGNLAVVDEMMARKQAIVDA